jgi:hypothetical protein
MAYEQKPGDIAVFKEREKRNDKAPDWRGNLIVPEGAKPGDKLEVAFWAKGSSGTMLAGSVKFPNQRDAGPGGGDNAQYSGQAGKADARRTYDLNDDIPFVVW